MSQKYKIVIADDEPFVREGLKILIDWEQENIDIVGVAENGIEALDLALKQEADILLTDIKMPGMDGLKLAQELKKRSSKYVSIIFISAYSDFKYAQKAVDLEALSYILKPIDEDRLIDILREAKSRIDANHKEFQENKNKELAQGLRQTLIKGEKHPLVEKHISSGLYRLIEISPNNSIIKLNENLLNQWESCSQANYYYFNYGVNEYILTSEQDLNKILAFMEHLQDLNVKMVISDVFSDLNQLYKDITQLHQLDFLYPKEMIFYHERIEALAQDTKFYDGYFERDILNKIKQNSKEGISLLLHDYRDHLRHMKIGKESIQVQMVTLYSFLTNTTKVKRHSHLDSRAIYAAENIDELLNVLENIMVEIMRSMNDLTDKKDIVEIIKDYTQKNFHQDLTLKYLAEKFNYNSAYLGKKFKEETNQTYNLYLDSVRLEKAKDLVLNSNYLIYEIAEMVGYGNLDYFYKKFKEYTTMSPSDYRKEHNDA